MKIARRPLATRPLLAAQGRRGKPDAACRCAPGRLKTSIMLKALSRAFSQAFDPAFRRVFNRSLLRSEEHTSELQALMRISYDGFCLQKNNTSTGEYKA